MDTFLTPRGMQDLELKLDNFKDIKKIIQIRFALSFFLLFFEVTINTYHEVEVEIDIMKRTWRAPWSIVIAISLKMLWLFY